MDACPTFVRPYSSRHELDYLLMLLKIWQTIARMSLLLWKWPHLDSSATTAHERLSTPPLPFNAANDRFTASCGRFYVVEWFFIHKNPYVCVSLTDRRALHPSQRARARLENELAALQAHARQLEHVASIVCEEDIWGGGAEPAAVVSSLASIMVAWRTAPVFRLPSGLLPKVRALSLCVYSHIEKQRCNRARDPLSLLLSS